MGTVKRILDYIIFIVVLGLILIIYFKDIKIAKLKEQLGNPTIEYVYSTKTDTIKVNVPVPKEIVKYKVDIQKDTIYQQLDLTQADSARIAEEYLKIFSNFAETKIYDDVLKDDSIAFIGLKEKVQYNRVFDRELIFEDKTPVIYKTSTVYKNNSSIVAGLSGNKEVISIGGGFVTKKNSIYLISFDPINKVTGVSFYLPIINF